MIASHPALFVLENSGIDTNNTQQKKRRKDDAINLPNWTFPANFITVSGHKKKMQTCARPSSMMFYPVVKDNTKLALNLSLTVIIFITKLLAVMNTSKFCIIINFVFLRSLTVTQRWQTYMFPLQSTSPQQTWSISKECIGNCNRPMAFSHLLSCLLKLKLKRLPMTQRHLKTRWVKITLSVFFANLWICPSSKST